MILDVISCPFDMGYGGPESDNIPNKRYKEQGIESFAQDPDCNGEGNERCDVQDCSHD